MNTQYPKVATSLVAGSIYLLCGCASMPPPNDEITRAQTAVNEAAEVESQDYAPLALRNARAKLQDARNAIEQEDFERAKQRAEEAQVDAELAEQKALSAKAEKSAQEIQKSIRLLRKEMGIPES